MLINGTLVWKFSWKFDYSMIVSINERGVRRTCDKEKSFSRSLRYSKHYGFGSTEPFESKQTFQNIVPFENVSWVGYRCHEGHRILTQSQVIFFESLNGGIFVLSSRPNLRHRSGRPGRAATQTVKALLLNWLNE